MKSGDVDMKSGDVDMKSGDVDMKSGDVETNPGPPIVYKDLVSIFKENRKKLKLIHVNCQSLIKKKSTMHQNLNDLGTNTIYGLSETWLKADDDETFWNLNIDYFKSYRCDRYLSQKDRGGGVMLFVPKSLNPKSRKDLNCMDAGKIESLWIQGNLTNDTKKKQKQLINISYNPNKNFTACFWKNCQLVLTML